MSLQPPEMTARQKLAWKIYCEATWPAVAKDFWHELNKHEKAWALAAAISVERGVLKLKEPTKQPEPQIDQEYWT